VCCALRGYECVSISSCCLILGSLRYAFRRVNGKIRGYFPLTVRTSGCPLYVPSLLFFLAFTLFLCAFQGDIGETVKELAGRARVGKLLPHEFQGGTFSVSNLGMFGVAEFSAVINPPQACIMAVGGGVRTVLPGLPIPAADAVLEASDSATASNAKATANGGGVSRGEPRVATLMTARVSVDRRVADEALAGQFLQCFKAYMSEPHLLML